MDKALEIAIIKTKKSMELINTDLREFKARHDGMYYSGSRDQYLKLGHIFNWTQSFHLGMAYWSYQVTKESSFLRWMYSFYKDYHDKVFKTPKETMHDLGFLYSPYAVALYRLTGDENMKKIGISKRLVFYPE